MVVVPCGRHAPRKAAISDQLERVMFLEIDRPTL